MNTILAVTTASVMSLGLMSCSDKKEPVEAPTNTTEAAVKPYPLDVCLVSGEPLGSMGEPHVFIHEGQEIKMCCDMCVPKFNEETAKYLAVLETGAPAADASAHDGHDHSGHDHSAH